MFGTLSRYIAARVLLMIGAVFVLCMVLIFMIDLVEMLRIATFPCPEIAHAPSHEVE